MASKAWEIAGPTSPFALHLDQRYLLIPELVLASGETLTNAPVAFKTYGKLNARGTNAIVVCHAVSGNALAAEWWDTLVGPGKVIDTNRFFVVCCNALGSPYGSASPVTRQGGELIDNGEWRPAPFVHASESQTQKTWWGSDFPQTTLRDDVHAHKHVLDYLGVEQVVLVIGGSMGGMLSLEWPLCYPVRDPASRDALADTKDASRKYIKAAAVMACPARHSAWAIAWSEIQRRTIQADQRFENGAYLLSNPPTQGLAAARMCAMITYRYYISLERRFERMRGKQNLRKPPAPVTTTPTSVSISVVEKEDAVAAPAGPQPEDPQERETYAVQSYLHHHGRKFNDRFDANCYIHLTLKLDEHDAARDRHTWSHQKESTDGLGILRDVLGHLGTSPVGCQVLVFSITSDVLYPTQEQQFLHECIPNSKLITIDSNEGHDAFLLEFHQIEKPIRDFIQSVDRPGKI
ncbi:homoserine O-acetyltransferase [Malassezia psittaci]|uniref:Homoserine O-acetyltransferase n=1 Tax=Malassezia psittaci TaxID=1821823 RepID=A0AAF0JCI9_9BASI|nr:homoserine O-acetyltransferase [Malassezia psittaci]